MQAARFIPFDPATQSLTGITNLKGLSLGDVFFDPDTGFVYRLVRLANDLTNGACADGELLVYKASGGTGFIVTQDVSDGIVGSTAPVPAGIAMGAFTDSSDTDDANAVCILVMIEGVHTNLLTDGNVVAGDALVADPANDGGVIEWAPTTTAATLAQLLQGTVSRVGTALADDSSTRVTALIKLGA